jgi:high-affinity iron transporter
MPLLVGPVSDASHGTSFPTSQPPPSALAVFLIVTTNFLLLIGAGLFSRSIGSFQKHAFNVLVGTDVDDIASAGDGPGSYNVRGNVWHLDCCNPEARLPKDGWTIFGAIFGWTNNATSTCFLCIRFGPCSFLWSVGTVLGYVFYWLAVIVVLIVMKFKEVLSLFIG